MTNHLVLSLALALASGGAGFDPGVEARISAELPYLRAEASAAWQHKVGGDSGYRWAYHATVTTPGEWYVGAGLGQQRRGYSTTFADGTRWVKSGWSPVAEVGWRPEQGRVWLRYSGADSTPTLSLPPTRRAARVGRGVSGPEVV